MVPAVARSSPALVRPLTLCRRSGLSAPAPGAFQSQSGAPGRPPQEPCRRIRGGGKRLTFHALETRVKFCDCWRSSGEEQLPCKQWVGGSNPPASASISEGWASWGTSGEIPKWPKGADCKSAGARLRGFKSSSPHHLRGCRGGGRGGGGGEGG